LEPSFCMIHHYSQYQNHQQMHWAGLEPHVCSITFWRCRMICHRIDIIAMCNKGSFSHVILLPCQTVCYENCIFVETSLSAPEWGETCHHGDARKMPLFFTGKKSFAGGRTFKMSKSGNGHLHRIIDFH
jgi:hypothetical protein